MSIHMGIERGAPHRHMSIHMCIYMSIHMCIERGAPERQPSMQQTRDREMHKRKDHEDLSVGSGSLHLSSHPSVEWCVWECVCCTVRTSDERLALVQCKSPGLRGCLANWLPCVTRLLNSPRLSPR